VLGIVNNVGLVAHETFDSLDFGTFATTMDLNVRPAVMLTQALLQGMRNAHFGRIINITSLVTRGLPWRSSYAAAKAALESLTRMVAAEFATEGAIAPGLNVVCPQSKCRPPTCGQTSLAVVRSSGLIGIGPYARSEV
jgi:NAD(P)-dependent dehydrogenase (short-subunit alcohol dehydrogenase family)